MGHSAGKNIYYNLGKKIDGLPIRAPWDKTLYSILRELYSSEEAEIVIKMPYGLSNLDRIAKIVKYNKVPLRNMLTSLCTKGLVIDLWLRDEYYYMPSPMMIGIFEFTMMRAGTLDSTRTLAGLFHKYLEGDASFFAANYKDGERISLVRTLPHEEAIKESDYTEVLDYEKATAIIEESDSFSIGLCSCRHEKVHIDEKKCDVSLETCSSFGYAADYLNRNNLARRVSKSEMLENLAYSKEMRLVLNADNVQKRVTFICHCCKCCCTLLSGISKFGYPNTVVTSNYISKIDADVCTGCGLCLKACPVNAIEMYTDGGHESKKKKTVVINESICLGCGVCGLDCKTGALKLIARGQRVLHPETTFERVILQCLERGTLQNQIFDNPQSITQKFMRAFIGASLKLAPVKKALLSDMLRSSFLKSMKKGVQLQGKGWLTEL